MPYLTEDELKATYYTRAANMQPEDVSTYLQRANSYAYGVIGGMPAFSADLPPEPLKAAVALAYEILSKHETGADVNPLNGNITEAAPAGFFARQASDPLAAVKVMLQPYAEAVARAKPTEQYDRGVMFL